MITSGLILIGLYFLLMYAFECIKYINKIDDRFGNSLWRWSYDYPVKGKQDISNIDDPEFVALRRRRNTAVTCMYWIFFLGFFVLMNFISQVLLKIFVKFNFSIVLIIYSQFPNLENDTFKIMFDLLSNQTLNSSFFLSAAFFFKTILNRLVS